MRRFLFLAILAIFLITPISSNGQTTAISVDVQNLARQEIAASPLAGVFVGHNFADSRYGGWTYTAVTPTWGEFLVGPSTHFTVGGRYFEFGVSAGFEQPGFAVRGGAYGLVSGKDLNALVFLEHGAGTGFWYFLRATHTISGPISAGIHGQRYFGFGPRFQAGFDFEVVNLDDGTEKTGLLKIWVAPVYDYEAENQNWGIAMGIGVSF